MLSQFESQTVSCERIGSRMDKLKNHGTSGSTTPQVNVRSDVLIGLVRLFARQAATEFAQSVFDATGKDIFHTDA